MNVKKLRLGLIGKDLSKSPSGRIHKFILGQLGVACDYENFSITKDELDSVVRLLIGDFDAFNVTIPYKRSVFEYLDGIQGDAVACGAVNTVVSATRQGYNTDGAGFLLMLATSGISVRGKSVLILGGGGSGRSSAIALKNAGAQVAMYRRNREELIKICEQLQIEAASDPEAGGYDMIVNCTGVGMHDTEGRSPVTAKAFEGASVAVDLIYVPEESEFLRLAREAGLQTLNGASMLFYQGYFADCLFLQRQPSETEAKLLYEKYKQSKTQEERL